jgi:glycine hydroxymethyltransferase
VRILEEVTQLASEVFRSRHAFVTPLSGNIADLAVLFALTSPGDGVAMIHLDDGGYPLGLEKFHRRSLRLPVVPSTYDIDLERALAVCRAADLVILGSSFIPFPHPVREISRVSTTAYDGSHVLGLVACGEFQDPLREGAVVLLGSTHKTLPGPQGGIVLTDSDEIADRLDAYLGFDLESGLGLVDNPHMNRVAALGIALEEISSDRTYGRRVIQNAKSLARTLHDLGLPMKFSERGFTESHQIFMDLPFDETRSLCRRLEQMGLFVDIAGRMGTAEVTRLGMGPDEMEAIAHLVVEAWKGRNVAEEVRRLRCRFSAP